jgi:uncharacterized sulfatase
MKPFVALLGVLGVLLARSTVCAAEKPNILLIYSDDHGWADLGAQGVDKEIRTPHLDQLARDGVRFARGYVSAPQCVPSRAGVITGRYQQKFGVEDNTRGPLPLAELTIAERLKPAGYATGMIGKWHLDLGGETGGGRQQRVQREHMPHAQGFDEYWRGEMRQFYASHDLKGRPFDDAPHLVTDDRFRVNVQTEAALAFLDRRAARPEQPWFLYLAWFAPHVPLESPEPWFSRTPARLPLERRQALAMMAAMDDGIGRIRAQLRAQGKERNTLIFFIGDNGAPLKEGAWNGSRNLPLVGEKGMLTDGGIRAPFLAAWPGTLPAGKTYEPPVINLDVAATAVALAGLPQDDKLDGVNLIPFLTGEKSGNPHDALFWRWRSQAAICADHWKLILLGKDARYLFDLDRPDGQSETTNLIARFPEVAADLEKKLMAWNATLPPPGLPRELNGQDKFFFDAHVNRTGVNAKKAAPKTRTQAKDTPAANDANQGWQGRNCTLAVADGALHIQPDAKATKPFITRNNLDLAGPVSATLRLRCPVGGTGEFSWRTRGQTTFPAGQNASFTLAATTDWQDVRVELPAIGPIIHVRLAFSGKSLPDVAAIALRGSNTTVATRWGAQSNPAQP